MQVSRSQSEPTVSEWHPASRRQFLLQITAGTEREVSDGDVRQFGPGSLILLEDITGKGHVTRSIEDGTNERLMLFLHLDSH